MDATTSAPPQQHGEAPTPVTTSPQAMPMIEELRVAASAGNVDKLRRLVEKEGPDSLLGTTRMGNTALHIAAMFGHNDVAKEVARTHPQLLAKPNDNNKYTPMHFAAASGNRALVESFLGIARSRGQGDLEGAHDGGMFLKEVLLAECKTGGTALHEAMRDGHVDVAMDLLEAEPEAAEKVDALGCSVLYVAVLKGSLEMAHKLLQFKNSSDRGPRSSNALLAAVILNRADIAGMLLGKRCMDGIVPLHRAAAENQVEMVRLLLQRCPCAAYVENEDGEAPIHTAAISGHVDTLREFLTYSPELAFILNSRCQNILSLAAANGRYHATVYILSQQHLSTLINQPDNRGYTALHWAAQKCHPYILGFLLDEERVNKVAITVEGYSARDVFCSSHRETPFTSEQGKAMMLLYTERRSAKTRNAQEE